MLFLVTMMTMSMTMAAVINGGSVSAGEQCGLLKGKCADGLKCSTTGLLGLSGVCQQVSQRGGPCNESLHPMYVHTCVEGTKCRKRSDIIGAPGSCIKESKVNGICNEDGADDAHIHLCEEGLHCVAIVKSLYDFNTAQGYCQKHIK